MVQCDSCGFYTHEGCYGITEADSRHSSDSVESTEPWFCNACLSNVNKPKCDLCPNEHSGLFKETQSGRFVHIACALYSPDVSFEDTDKLWPVVLNEISAKKWGDRICSLCDNLYMSRSGVCIKCDAGLCKTYFHVTCAMKHGLLVDPFQQNANDPFFAYCKQHNDSDQIRQRKLKYIQMIEANNKQQLNLTLNERTKIKFKHAQTDYNLKRKQAHLPRQETHKTARLLTTNPSSLKQLMQKSNLNSSQKHTVQKHSVNQVTFTSEFVKYYYDRELKLEQLYKEIPQMKKLQTDLTNQEQELRLAYESKLKEKEKLLGEFTQQSKLFDACIDMFIEQKKLKHKLKDLLDVKLVQIESDESVNVSSLNNSEASSRLEQSNKRAYRKRKPQFESQISLDAECFICKQKTNSHLLVECDTCKTYYHINCLEPPLSAVPKKTKLYGWECAKCVRKKESDYEDEDVKEIEEDNDKRSLRRERKQTRSNLQDTLEMEHLLKLVKKKEKRGRKKKIKVSKKKSSHESTSSQNKQETPNEPKKRRPYTKRKKLESNNSTFNVSSNSTINTTKNEMESLIDSVVQESIIINTSSDECDDSANISELETVKKKLKV